MSSQHSSVLINALIEVGEILGLDKTDALHVVGVESDCISIDQGSRAGEKAALLIRIYIDLYSLMGGNMEDQKFWMRTANKGTGGVPAEQVLTNSGLDQVASYLDGIRDHSIARGNNVDDRVARIERMALDVFNSREIATDWLNSPNRGIGSTPLEAALESEDGARAVEQIMQRIERGVYS